MRRTVRLAIAFVVLVAGYGCVTQPAQDSALHPEAPTTGDESPERVRARVHAQLAASYLEIGNLGVALEEVKEALTSDPSYGPAYNVAGILYSRLKEDRLAEQNFQRALSLNPNDSDAHNNYGSFLCNRKQEQEAVKHFLAAVRNPLYPSPDRSYVNAGLCSRRAGNLAEAAEYFQAALKIRPGEAQALFQLAEMSYLRGDYAGAKGYLGSLAHTGVSTAEVLWLGARVERRLGNANAEASYARQLKNRFPDSAEARALGAGRYE
ncbi:MAG TPA: type IV pilus biogenesis/stability protein PilW [Burkholderiales bacterium]|nr:type IV pilus biogenesis/stability protein PilW [Burkholderiales bacterium]